MLLILSINPFVFVVVSSPLEDQSDVESIQTEGGTIQSDTVQPAAVLRNEDDAICEFTQSNELLSPDAFDHDRQSNQTSFSDDFESNKTSATKACAEASSETASEVETSELPISDDHSNVSVANEESQSGITEISTIIINEPDKFEKAVMNDSATNSMKVTSSDPIVPVVEHKAGGDDIAEALSAPSQVMEWEKFNSEESRDCDSKWL